MNMVRLGLFRQGRKKRQFKLKICMFSDHISNEIIAIQDYTFPIGDSVQKEDG